MFVETTFRIAAWGSGRPTFAGLTPGPVLQLERRVRDVLDLDLAGAHVGHATVVCHVAVLLSKGTGDVVTPSRLAPRALKRGLGHPTDPEGGRVAPPPTP